MKALRKASTLDDVYQAFRGEPLGMAEMAVFYQATESIQKCVPHAEAQRTQCLTINDLVAIVFQ